MRSHLRSPTRGGVDQVAAEVLLPTVVSDPHSSSSARRAAALHKVLYPGCSLVPSDWLHCLPGPHNFLSFVLLRPAMHGLTQSTQYATVS